MTFRSLSETSFLFFQFNVSHQNLLEQDRELEVLRKEKLKREEMDLLSVNEEKVNLNKSGMSMFSRLLYKNHQIQVQFSKNSIQLAFIFLLHLKACAILFRIEDDKKFDLMRKSFSLL